MEQIAYQPDWHKLMIARRGIKVRLGEAVTVDLIKHERPDLVIVATGGQPVIPDVEGLGAALDSGFARTLDDVLRSGKALADGPVVVFGASYGVELAVDLAQQGRKVRLLDPAAKFIPANYIGSRLKYLVMWMAKADLVTEQGATLIKVGSRSVTVALEGGEQTIACGTLVLAPDRVPYEPFSRALQGTGIAVQVIGDALKVRSYGNAIHEAAYLARNIG
jgi:pyruvate/2-oxoglutarate dehydrogenase complex dihydrolipoamide dehydrogenase (E3) component